MLEFHRFHQLQEYFLGFQFRNAFSTRKGFVEDSVRKNTCCLLSSDESGEQATASVYPMSERVQGCRRSVDTSPANSNGSGQELPS
ncbi:MAG: hypothetical protein P1U77_24090 [Rubripirellula sp.]|nr:hypothetical protein [Rubripirellula sp.]